MRIICATPCTQVLPPVAAHAGSTLAVRIGLTSALVTLDGNSAEQIDGQLTRIMVAGESANLIINRAATAWQKLSGKSIALSVVLGRTTTQSIPSATWTPIAMNAQQSGYAGMYDAGNGRTPIVRPGVYNVTVGTYLSGVTPSAAVYVAVGLNASTPVTPASLVYPAFNDAQTVGLRTVTAAVGDYIASIVYAAGGGTVDIAGLSISYLAVTEVSPW